MVCTARTTNDTPIEGTVYSNIHASPFPANVSLPSADEDEEPGSDKQQQVGDATPSSLFPTILRSSTHNQVFMTSALAVQSSFG
jgi:hypothetical protein